MEIPRLNIHIINQAKIELEKNGIIPRWIKLSPNAHQVLIEELNKRDGKKHSRIFEIMGLRVDIDDECPGGGGYMEGKDEMLR